MQVDIWSDVVCPWCAIGKARFERALADFPHRDAVAVRWRSFELDPQAPPVIERSYADHLAGKYRVSRAEADAMIERVVQAAAEVGLEFRYDRARPGNTFDAHRLLHLAADRGIQQDVKDRFLRGYHSEGQPIGEHATLHRLAVEAGLDADEVSDVLTGNRYADAVRGDEAQARAYGATGVPFFVIDGRFGISGAQTPDVILQVLGRAWDEAA